jgi:outer membrane protein assembly factor BamB
MCLANEEDRMTPGIRRTVSAAAAALIVTLITAAPSMATDWPQFGFSAGHTGANPYETILGPTEVAHLTLGYRIATKAAASQPIIVNGIGYASAGTHIVAFDAASGVVLWRRPTCSGAVGHLDVPAYSGDNLWLIETASAGDHILTMMDPASGVTTCRAYPGGGDASLTAARGMVYVAYESDNTSQGAAGAIDAIRATDGTILWTARLVGTWPNQPALANGKIFETTQGGLCYRLDARTGKIDWVRYLDADIRGATVSDGRVYVTGEFGLDTTTWALSAKTGRTVWTSPAVVSATGLLVVDRGRVFASKYDTPQVVALDAATGRKLWTEFGGGGDDGQLTAANRLVYQISGSGQILALGEGGGRIVATIGDPGTFSPQTAVTVVNGTLFASMGGGDAGYGIQMWRLRA